MDQVVLAGMWGLVAGSALLLGAALGYGVRIPQWVVASVMAFGAGVLLSAVSFELVEEAYDQAGLAPAAIGTVGGALAYTAGNVWLARRGARHRKRSDTGSHSRRRPSSPAPGWRWRWAPCWTVCRNRR